MSTRNDDGFVNTLLDLEIGISAEPPEGVSIVQHTYLQLACRTMFWVNFFSMGAQHGVGGAKTKQPTMVRVILVESEFNPYN
jgi:hypothetical protein